MFKFAYAHFLVLFFLKWVDFEGFSGLAHYDYIHVVFAFFGLMDE